MFPKLAALTLVGLIIGCTASWAEQRGSTAAGPARASHYSHYVEFRVAQIGTYGHSYAAFGRLNAKGEPAEFHYADLHPAWAGYIGMAIGHVFPVPANTEWNPDVAKLPIASSYRRKLSGTQYKKLLAAVRRARANRNPYWNGLTNNCNHFVAELARSVGLRVPTSLQVAYAFVPSLRELNEADRSKGRDR